MILAGAVFFHITFVNYSANKERIFHEKQQQKTGRDDNKSTNTIKIECSSTFQMDTKVKIFKHFLFIIHC